MDYKTRIKILKGSRSTKEFSSLLGIPMTTLHTYLNGREPSVNFIKRVHDKLNVRVEWLITGRGPIYETDVFHEDCTFDKIVNFLEIYWPKWSQKEHCWFELQFRKNFPEFEFWLINGHAPR
ncbi:MAG: helix-turn-helix transcriptional regulator [Thermodesulfovibrionales bacterium]|nr:helix-turn-helix transcriptional regulator [Thermodesulfovibrionales bacterium]